MTIRDDSIRSIRSIRDNALIVDGLPPQSYGKRYGTFHHKWTAVYIFCADCLWFGTSLVSFAWAYELGTADRAVFQLNGVPNDNSGYSAKTPWVARSDYSGPVLIRGHQVDGSG